MKIENQKLVYFRKVNIFGDSFVGKSSFISWIENYKNKDFEIKSDDSDSSYDELSSYLVEQAKRVVYPEKENTHFLLYETNLDRYDSVKMNLDTLLFQSECVLLMWDESEQFENISSLISCINTMISNKRINNIDIYLIQNKTDLNNEPLDEINKEIESLKQEFNNLYIYKISILKKEGLHDLLSSIYHDVTRKEAEQKK